VARSNRGSAAHPQQHPARNRRGLANSYNFHVTSADGTYPEGRFTQRSSLDGQGEFTVFRNEPMGEKPVPGPARPDSGAQAEQIA
jgi:Mn-containing catalase